MKQVVQDYKTGKLEVKDVPPPSIKSGGVLVKNVCSVVSVGTEKMTVTTAQSGLLGKIKKRPDLVKQVVESVRKEGLLSTYRKTMGKLEVLRALGYSSAGVVIEVAQEVDEFQVGDRVACGGGGYASHAEIVFVPKNLCVKIPNGVNFEEASFTTIGAIAIQGVRQAGISVGENVAVIGLGLVGQITAQILKAAGCNVLGMDILPSRVELAKDCGIDQGVVLGRDDVFKIVDFFTDGRGVDAVLLTASTSSNKPMEMAGDILRDRGRVVVVGAVRMDIPRGPYYAKELEVKLSRSYGPGRYDPVYEEKGIDYPLGYVRWTEKRNMEAFLKLLADGKVNIKKLITHKFDIKDAVEAYNLILENTQNYLGIMIVYPYLEKKTFPTKIKIKAKPKKSSSEILNIGFIGAGSFAQKSLLPNILRLKEVNLKGVATATGVNARRVAEKFGFEYCTTNAQQILEDPEIDCVFIATRHNLHARFVSQALARGKETFVEKPLALNHEELKRIIEAYEKSSARLIVGFNRRFAPAVVEAKKFFQNRKGLMIINYRVNAGFIPSSHWVHDPEEGGGRIKGEVCHFIDLIIYLAKARPIKVLAERVNTLAKTESIINDDNLIITLKLEDGSLGCISYIACGDISLPKERIEIFADNSTVVIEDFKSVSFYREGKWKKRRLFGKGHKEELVNFIDCVKKQRPSPISFEELVLTTITTFKVIESLRKGLPEDV